VLFHQAFKISPGSYLEGYIAYYIPNGSTNVHFIYEEWNFEEYDRVSVKHYYKVAISYGISYGPVVLSAAEFSNKALAAGYDLEIEEDYDGHGTYWVGAHKFAPGANKAIDLPLYTIDYTLDASISNAKVEYNIYVSDVKKIVGSSKSDSGTNFQYLIRSGIDETDMISKFGVAYRIDAVNYFVVAPIEYKDEIIAFFKVLGFNISI